MRVETIKKVAAADNAEDLKDLIDATLEATFRSLQIQGRILVSAENVDRELLSRMFVFCAEMAHEAGETCDEFLTSMDEAFKLASEGELEEDDEVDDKKGVLVGTRESPETVGDER